LVWPGPSSNHRAARLHGAALHITDFRKADVIELNAFDFVVTVALGSTLATILLSKSVALAEGILAILMLVLLQFCISWLSVRSNTFQDLIKSDPTLVYYSGQFLDGPLRRERLTREEILAAIRERGMGDLDAVGAVVLETDGSISVLEKPQVPQRGVLKTVDREHSGEQTLHTEGTITHPSAFRT
jgi:uncharacterized membrane protein YcaP (DUF421 family)